MTTGHTPILVAVDASAAVVSTTIFVTTGNFFAMVGSILSVVWLCLRIYQDPTVKPRVERLLVWLRLKA